MLNPSSLRQRKLRMTCSRFTAIPFHDQLHVLPILVMCARGFDLGAPATPRHPDGRVAQPPSGGWGHPACADNVNVHSPSHSRNPKRRRWHDHGDDYWE
eukprot:1512314-Pyramimonas_sp.AAC.1